MGGGEKRRPHEFELVGEGELAHQADRRDRHLRFIEPGRLRDVDELKGDARRETEHQHRRDSPVGEEMAQKRRRLRALYSDDLHVDPRPEGSLTVCDRCGSQPPNGDPDHITPDELTLTWPEDNSAWTAAGSNQ